MDFLASADKLSKEQARRRDEAKKKLAEERSAAERQRQRAIAETQLRADILRRAQEEADEKRLAHEREALLTGGIRFEETLIAFSRDDLEEDRICLPQQALETLTSQDAMSNGVMLFRISRLEDGKIISTSHCGVREFSAAEGTCILPPKVIDSLYSDEEVKSHKRPLDSPIQVQIKYVRLPKLTYIKLRPLENKFSAIVPVKNMLEENLMKHATLSVGDLLTVWYRGVEHKTRVMEARPADAGCLIDTNVEVDLDTSEEFQRHTMSTEATVLNGDSSTKKTIPSSGSSYSYKLGMFSEASAVKVVPAVDMSLQFPPEPSADITENCIDCRIKTPAGRLLQRRFRQQDFLLGLFHYCVSELGTEVCTDPSRLQLNTRFPKRQFTINDAVDDKTFEDVGLTSSQEMFLLSIVC